MRISPDRQSPFEHVYQDERRGLPFRIALIVFSLAFFGGLYAILLTAFDKVDPLLFMVGSLVMIFLLAGAVRLEWGVFLWIITGPILTIGLVTVAGGKTGGTLYPSLLLVSFLLGAWFLRMLLAQQFDIPRTPFNHVFLFFCAWGLFCVWAGNVYWDYMVRTSHRNIIVQLFCAGMYILPLGTIWMVGSQLKSQGQIRFYLKVLVFIALWTITAGIFTSNIPRMEGIRFDPLVRAHGMAVACAYAFVVRGRTRTFMIVTVLVCLSTVFYQFFGHEEAGQWLSGWVALCVPIAVVVFFRSRKMFGILTVISVLFLIACLPYVTNVLDQAEHEGDYGRFEVWSRSFRMANRQNPLFGVGPGNFWDYHDSYFGGGNLGLTSAHGQYQQIVAETGYVGFVLLLWLVFSIFRYLVGVCRRVRGPVLSSLAIGAVGSFSGLLLASLFGDYLFPTYHNAGYSYFSTTIFSWVIIGGVVAVDRYCRANPGERF